METFFIAFFGAIVGGMLVAFAQPTTPAPSVPARQPPSVEEDEADEIEPEIDTDLMEHRVDQIARRFNLLPEKVAQLLRVYLEEADALGEPTTFRDFEASLERVLGRRKPEPERKKRPVFATSGKPYCPWCKAELVRKRGRYGHFAGCVQYPKCRYGTTLGKAGMR